MIILSFKLSTQKYWIYYSSACHHFKLNHHNNNAAQVHPKPAWKTILWYCTLYCYKNHESVQNMTIKSQYSHTGLFKTLGLISQTFYKLLIEIMWHSMIWQKITFLLKAVSLLLMDLRYHNVKIYTAHTIVSWPNPKQWKMDHKSDLMMIMR